MAWQGKAWLGKAWRGKARQGKDYGAVLVSTVIKAARQSREAGSTPAGSKWMQYTTRSSSGASARTR
jgi:hypothetical protein